VNEHTRAVEEIGRWEAGIAYEYRSLSIGGTGVAFLRGRIAFGDGERL